MGFFLCTSWLKVAIVGIQRQTGSLSIFICLPDTAYVRVFISDVNDNKPAFGQVSYEVDVDEDADVGFAILTVSANDGDEGR